MFMRTYYFHNIGVKCTERNANHIHKFLSREWTASKFIMIGDLFHLTIYTCLVHVFLAIEELFKNVP